MMDSWLLRVMKVSRYTLVLSLSFLFFLSLCATRLHDGVDAYSILVRRSKQIA